jgi:hypothetical protein
MKNLFLVLILISGIIFYSIAQESVTESQQKEFERIAQTFQTKYMQGSENCDYLIQAFDKNVKMSEIQFTRQMQMTYEQLVQFCPHLPKKEVIQTVTEQRLLTTDLAYDYVSQLYLRKSKGDTIRETSSRIWKLKNNEWKIIQMNSSLNKACD